MQMMHIVTLEFGGVNIKESKSAAEETMPKIVDWLKNVLYAGECLQT